MNRLLSMFGFARRAGALILGFDPVKEAVVSGKVKRVYLANNLSERTKESMTGICKEGGVICVMAPFSMEEIGRIVGKESGIFAVTDPNMDKKISTMCE